jgi:hypothetical protein
MKRVIELRAPDGRHVVLVGGILGLVADMDLVRREFERVRPAAVGLGVPFEDLDAIRSTAGKEATHEFEASDVDEVYLAQLKAFGAVQTPPPDLYELFQLASEAQVPIEAIDLGDEAFTERFTENVGFFEVMRDNRNRKKILTREVPAPSAEEFVIAWDEHLYPTKGLRRVQDAREDMMAKAIAASAPPSSLHLLPLARLEGVAKRLRALGWAPL